MPVLDPGSRTKKANLLGRTDSDGRPGVRRKASLSVRAVTFWKHQIHCHLELFLWGKRGDRGGGFCLLLWADFPCEFSFCGACGHERAFPRNPHLFLASFNTLQTAPLSCTSMLIFNPAAAKMNHPGLAWWTARPEVRRQTWSEKVKTFNSGKLQRCPDI